ncbi:MAG: hypothetical protein RHS_5087 [Robinsoniella sp. RHS]|nr:MAG: hypothetical protein RHS_5087 [Robinsoniella sp. RHS]
MAGCSLLDAAQYVSAVCVKEDGSLSPFSGYRNEKQILFSKISCFAPVASGIPQPPGPIMLRKPALFQRMLSRKEKGASQDIDLEGV